MNKLLVLTTIGLLVFSMTMIAAQGQSETNLGKSVSDIASNAKPVTVDDIANIHLLVDEHVCAHKHFGCE